MIYKLLSSDGYTPVNKFLARELGFVTAGYFGELIRQGKRFYDSNRSKEFYFSQKQMEDEIGLSEYDQRKCLKILTDKGLVSVEKKGLPARYHFIINEDAVFNLFKTCSGNTEEQVVENMKRQSFKIGSTGHSKFEAHNKKEIIRSNNKKDINSENQFSENLSLQSDKHSLGSLTEENPPIPLTPLSLPVAEAEAAEFKAKLTAFIKAVPARRKIYNRDILKSFYDYRTEETIKGKNKGHIRFYNEKSRNLEGRLDRFLYGKTGTMSVSERKKACS